MVTLFYNHTPQFDAIVFDEHQSVKFALHLANGLGAGKFAVGALKLLLKHQEVIYKDEFWFANFLILPLHFKILLHMFELCPKTNTTVLNSIYILAISKPISKMVISILQFHTIQQSESERGPKIIMRF